MNITHIQKRFLLGVGLSLCLSFYGNAQQTLPPELQKMQIAAREYLQQEDFANSIMLLNQAIRQAPDNVSLRRDLAYTYYLSGKAEKAREVIKPVVQSEFADEQSFQIAAAIEKSLDKYSRAKRILKNGLKRFPHSGLLYNNLGNLYSTDKSEKAALETWQQGIAADPGFGRNYYGAALMYQAQGQPVWALIYGETYLNLEQDPMRGNEVKKMMIQAYQTLLSEGADDKLPTFRGSTKEEKESMGFETCFRRALSDQATVVKEGLNTETLTMLRTRFLMEWMRRYAHRFPTTLFSWQNKMIHAGFFDAYNQWLFGAVNDSRLFQIWIKTYADNYASFQQWQGRNPLQPASYDPKPE